MIEYNKNALQVFKDFYKLTYQDIMKITGLKGIASVYLRLNNKIPLNAEEIAALCNESEKISLDQFNNNNNKDSFKIKVFSPSDFYTVL